jgi:hypothetical protein
MKEHELVVLTHGVSEHGLAAGDVGTVVHVYPGGGAFEVEFASADGRTAAVLTLGGEALRPLAPGEILHTRRLTER